MSTGNGQWRSMSMIYTGHFSYKERYVIDFSLRADGTTRFGDDKKWGWFPGISARWNIGDEPFMKWSRKWLSMLSFRPSWGIVGRPPGSEYVQYAKYSTEGVYGGMSNTHSVTYLEGLQLNKLMCECDMSLSKSILKDKIGLKLQAIDLFRQYKSVAYVVNERGIHETHSVSLPSYLLFSVTYKFNKQPKKK